MIGHHHDHRHPFPRPPLGFGDAPVGAVIAYAGVVTPSSPPDNAETDVEAWGWMVCDGRTLIMAKYPQLFAAIGYLYGGSDGSFAIPDYRGLFLRGANTDYQVNGTSGADPDTAMRVAPANGTQQGVGSTQPTAIQTHEHNYYYAGNAQAATTGPESAGALTSTTQPTTGGPVQASPPAGDAVPVSKHETRPVNTYVNYLVKYAADVRPTFF